MANAREQATQPDPPHARAATLSVERLPPEGWEDIEDWDAAVAAAARPSVFLTRDWQVAWWSAFGDGLEPVMLRVADHAGATVGIAPLYRKSVNRGPFHVRRLALVGDQAAGSEYLGLVARAGRELEVARATVDHLAREGIGWDVVELHGLVEGDPAGAALQHLLAAGAERARIERHGCSLVRLPADFEAYLSGLGSKFRQSYRQRANKLARTSNPRFFVTAGEDALDAHLARLFAMHQDRWTAAGRPGVFSDPRMRAFYRDAARRLLAAGRLRFWQLEIDRQIRASQFGFVYGGVLISLQEAYDTTYRAPGVGGLGVVLRGHALRAAIAEGLVGYDFLGGVEDFKTRWGTETHYVRSVEIGHAGRRGHVGWLATAGVRDARRALARRIPESVKARRRRRGEAPAAE